MKQPRDMAWGRMPGLPHGGEGVEGSVVLGEGCLFVCLLACLLACLLLCLFVCFALSDDIKNCCVDGFWRSEQALSLEVCFLLFPWLLNVPNTRQTVSQVQIVLAQSVSQWQIYLVTFISCLTETHAADQTHFLPSHLLSWSSLFVCLFCLFLFGTGMICSITLYQIHLQYVMGYHNVASIHKTHLFIASVKWFLSPFIHDPFPYIS